MSRLSPHRIGETIAGRYRLISRLGEGGFGVAYRAWDQHSGVPIVLKMPLAKHLVRPVVLQRFEREVLRLRQCSHPHIVPIIDDGHDDHGRPFLVMRFLPGGSLADRKKPVGPAALHRWLPAVASALDYIHGEGVLHRDIKPANIFFDTRARAYLGDFGIAKLVDDGLSNDVRYSPLSSSPHGIRDEGDESLTATGQFMGTVPYAAPEAFDDRSLITPHADQYSLAVAVYEMLSASWPVEEKDKETFRDFHHSPREPVSLANRMSNLPASLVSAVDKALAKRPEYRFATCQEFAAAVLADVPFTPVDPSHHRFMCPACHRLVRVPQDFGGRNCRCPECNVVLRVSPSLDALWRREESPAATTQPRNRQAERAPTQVVDSGGSTGLSKDSRVSERVENLTNLEKRAVQLKEQGLYAESAWSYERLLQDSANDPRDSSSSETARWRAELGALYKLQRRYDAAIGQYQQVLCIQESIWGTEHPETVGALLALASIYSVQRNYRVSQEACGRALRIQEQTLGLWHPEVAKTLIAIVAIHRSQGELGLGETLCRRALAICLQAYGPVHGDTASVLSNLGAICRLQGKDSMADKALGCARSVREMLKARNHSSSFALHRGLATQLNNLAVHYDEQAEYSQAEVLYQHAIAMLGGKEWCNVDHATILENAGRNLSCQDKNSKAETFYVAALAMREKLQGLTHEDTAKGLACLAGLYGKQGRFNEAELLYRRSLAIREKLLGPDHADTATNLSYLAAMCCDQGKYDEAEQFCKRVLAICGNHQDVATSLAYVADVYRTHGRYDEATPLYKRALAIREDGLDHKDTATSLTSLAELYGMQGKHDDAEPLYKRSLAIRENLLGWDNADTVRSLADLTRNYLKQGKVDSGKDLLARVLATLVKELGPDHPHTRAVRDDLAAMQAERTKKEAGL